MSISHIKVIVFLNKDPNCIWWS